jgi:variant SH3 domain-containing protein
VSLRAILSAAAGKVSGVRQVIARRSHEISERPPVQLEVGDDVEVGERDTEWPEFVFVTGERGAGWVPSRHLSSSSGPAVVKIPYDTTELPTEVGDVLLVVAEDLPSGWLWCRSGTGREGWIPVKTVEELS